MGPTASGKTDLAERLAEILEAQLINADAFQVYRGMDLGTAKPENKGRYQLLDLKDPNQQYGVGEFCRDALAELQNLYKHQTSAILVGGTGFYIRALLGEYDALQSQPNPELRENLQARLKKEGLQPLVEELLTKDPNTKIDIKNPVRVTRALERLADPNPPIKVDLPPFNTLKLGIEMEVDLLNRRIEERTARMVQNGWVQEVRQLLDSGYGPGDPGFRAIGYSEIARHLTDGTDLEEATAAATAETRRYAKRQRTWLRSEPSLVRISGGDDALATALSAVRAMHV